MKISMEDLSHTRIKISDVFTHSIFSILIIFSASQMMIGVLQLSIQLTKLISPVKSYSTTYRHLGVQRVLRSKSLRSSQAFCFGRSSACSFGADVSQDYSCTLGGYTALASHYHYSCNLCITITAAAWLHCILLCTVVTTLDSPSPIADPE